MICAALFVARLGGYHLWFYRRLAMKKWIVVVSGLLVLLVGARVDAQATKPATTKAVTQEDLERQFAEMLSGSTLVGKFTEEKTPRPEPMKPAEDRYTL